MIEISELCKHIIKERYNIRADKLNTINQYRQFYDFAQRNKNLIGANDYDFDIVVDNFNALLDYIENDNERYLDIIKSASEVDKEKIKKAKVKMKKTILNSIESLSNSYGFYEIKNKSIKNYNQEVIENEEHNFMDSKECELSSLIEENENLRKEYNLLLEKYKNYEKIIGNVKILLRDKEVLSSIPNDLLATLLQALL